VALSPDGRTLAYVGNNEESRTSRLWLRRLGEETSQPIAGTDNAAAPFWSPDGRFVGYIADGEIWRVAAAGGPPTKIFDLASRDQTQLGIAWGDDDHIVFGGRGLHRAPARGNQAPVVLTTLADGESSHGAPWILPGGRQVLFSAYKGLEPQGVFAVDMQTGTRTPVLPDAVNAQFANGMLVFLRGSVLMAQPFDPATVQLSGEPQALADPILANMAIPRVGAFSVSQTGAVMYIPLAGGGGTRLMWVTRDGQQTVVDDNVLTNRHLAVSPDGARAALIPMTFDGVGELWTLDLKRGVRTPITHDAQPMTALWSADGRTLYYSGRKSGSGLDIYKRSDFGAGPEVLVYRDDHTKLVTSV
jgi:hypothetical protein